MRYVALLFLVPTLADAQTRQGEAAEAVPVTAAAAATPLAPAADIPTDEVVPLATSTRDARIVSKNEAYNRARLAEGRLGARLGNDQSYRITGN